MSQDAYRLKGPDGSESQLPVRKGTVGPDVIDIGRLYRDHGAFTYDPGFVATGSCESDITFIDGEQSADEKQLLGDLVGRLKIPEDEANELLSAAEDRAKRLLELI